MPDADLTGDDVVVLLVDAANVVGATPDGWWRDRAGAARRLVARLRAAPALPRPVVVVLEGRARPGAAEGTAHGVRVVHAPGSGDDTLAALARDSDLPVTLVSADRGLADRVRAAGAEVRGPRWLLEQLPPAG